VIADILEKKLEAAGLGLVAGDNLFRNTMPGDVKVGVMTREPLAGMPINPFIEGWYKPRMQVIVRHTDPVEGRALANQVIKALLVEGREKHEATEEHGACHIDLFYPDQEPIQYPRLDGNTIEWSLNFNTAFGIKPGWR
jgi:hypothetical protein